MKIIEKRAGTESISAIREIVGAEHVRTSKADLYVYGFDAKGADARALFLMDGSLTVPNISRHSIS